jgi:hypothetical protein
MLRPKRTRERALEAVPLRRPAPGTPAHPAIDELNVVVVVDPSQDLFLLFLELDLDLVDELLDARVVGQVLRVTVHEAGDDLGKVLRERLSRPRFAERILPDLLARLDEGLDGPLVVGVVDRHLLEAVPLLRQELVHVGFRQNVRAQRFQKLLDGPVHGQVLRRRPGVPVVGRHLLPELPLLVLGGLAQGRHHGAGVAVGGAAHCAIGGSVVSARGRRGRRRSHRVGCWVGRRYESVRAWAVLRQQHKSGAKKKMTKVMSMVDGTSTVVQRFLRLWKGKWHGGAGALAGVSV